jgi:hypothetical protein
MGLRTNVAAGPRLTIVRMTARPDHPSMATGVTRGQHVVQRAVMVGVATLIVALAWRVTFLVWVPNTTNRYDIAEPFLHPWTGLTWTTQVVLWLGTLSRAWPWIPLVAIGLLAAAIQSWIGLESA